MRKSKGGVKGLVLLLFGLGLELSACSAGVDKCGETRTCPEPVGFIDAGNFDNWWSAGAADESTGAPATAEASVVAGGAEERAMVEGGAGGADSGASSEPAQVLNVSPADGAVGVESNAAIVIAFSEPVDTAAFAAAYESADLPAVSLVSDWNEAHDVLTMKPKSALTYQTGLAPAAGVVDFLPKTYHFGFANFVTGEAGHVLEARTFSFSTLREVTTELPADPLGTGNWTDGEGEGIHNCLRTAMAPYVPSVCVGDDSSNVRYTGFVSFDLSGLPVGISEFSSARLVADAIRYGSTALLGTSALEHVAFGALGEAALSAPQSASLGAFYSGADLASGSRFDLEEDVASAVTEDYARRTPGSSLTQYRLGFSKVFANAAWDDIELRTIDIRLTTTYLLP